jgi:FdhD protein
VDKVIGESILERIPTKDKIIMSSGRTTSEILVKAARAQSPIVISKAAPTDLAVQLANDFGLTLIGFARGSRMNIYSNPQRIAPGGKARKHRRDA